MWCFEPHGGTTARESRSVLRRFTLVSQLATQQRGVPGYRNDYAEVPISLPLALQASPWQSWACHDWVQDRSEQMGGVSLSPERTGGRARKGHVAGSPLSKFFFREFLEMKNKKADLAKQKRLSPT